MKQSRLTSFLKSCVSTAVGFGIAFVANMLILPWFGFDISHSQNVLLTAIYTGISIARGYLLERFYEALGWRTRMSAFASAVLFERQRQITQEGWSLEHDDRHERGDLASAGACYAECAGVNADENKEPPAGWPWEGAWWKPVGFRRDLVKACALIIAEGEKFDRNRKSRDRTADAIAARRESMVDAVASSNPNVSRADAERVYDDALRGPAAERG